VSVTVACVFVRGEYPYTVEYVTRLRAMVERWIDRPFRFACLTDQPEQLPPSVEPIVIEKLPGFAYWSKLELFNPARQWKGRVLYLDLDSLIVSYLDRIVDMKAAFALIDDGPNVGRKQRPRDAFGRLIVRRFNSSCMVWDGGTQTHLYTDWTPADGERLSGDQDYLGEKAQDATAMPAAWFPRISQVGPPPWPWLVKVILAKKPKNHEALRQYPWVAPLWGAA
jgi:hypothetical protein